MLKSEKQLLDSYSFSYLSDGILASVLPLLAIYLNKPDSYGSLLVSAFNLPWLLISVLSGYIIDKYSPILVFRISSIMRMILLCLISFAATKTDINFKYLLLLVFALGSTHVFFINTIPTVTPKIIDKEKLFDFNKKLESRSRCLNMVVGKLVGPMISSLFFPLALIVTFILYLSTALSLPQFKGFEETGKNNSTLSDTWLWIKNSKLMKILLLTGAINNTVYASVLACLPIYIHNNSIFSDHLYNWTLFFMGLGFISGPKLLEVFNRFVTFKSVSLSTSVITPLSLFLLFFAKWWPLLPLSFFLFGVSFSCRNIVNWTLMQQSIPEKIIGKVTSLQRSIGWSGLALGPLFGSLIIQNYGASFQILFYSFFSLFSLCILIKIFIKNSNDFVIIK